MPPLPVAKPREAAAQIARALGKVNALQSLCRKSSQFLAYIHLKESNTARKKLSSFHCKS